MQTNESITNCWPHQKPARAIKKKSLWFSLEHHCDFKNMLSQLCITLGVIMCQYNHYCNIDTIGCSSRQTSEPKYDKRLNLDLFSVFYIFHCLWCASFFSFCATHLFSAKPITWGGHHVFRVWEDTKSVNFILSPLLSVQTAPPQQFFWRLFTFLVFCHLLHCTMFFTFI